MKVIHSRVNKNKLDTVPVTDGQIIYVKDTHELYFDVNNTRTKATDIIFVDTVVERDAIVAPFQNKVYCVLENNKLCRYDGTNWVDLGGDVTKNYVDTNFIKKDNTTAFTPTDDYNPSTKKYVDDSISSFTPLQSFPEGTVTNSTTVAFFNSIKATNPATGSLFLGMVRLTDMPTSLSQAEVEVHVYNNNVLYATMKSADTAPYIWYANSFQYRGWEATEVSPTAQSTTFDNTGTGLVSTNVEDAIKELLGKVNNLDTKIGEIDTIVDEINGE